MASGHFLPLAYALPQGSEQAAAFEKFSADMLGQAATAGDKALLRRAVA